MPGTANRSVFLLGNRRLPRRRLFRYSKQYLTASWSHRLDSAHNSLKRCNNWIVPLLVRLIPVNRINWYQQPDRRGADSRRASPSHSRRTPWGLPVSELYFRQYPSESGVPGSDQQTSEGRAWQFDHVLAAYWYLGQQTIEHGSNCGQHRWSWLRQNLQCMTIELIVCIGEVHCCQSPRVSTVIFPEGGLICLNRLWSTSRPSTSARRPLSMSTRGIPITSELLTFGSISTTW